MIRPVLFLSALAAWASWSGVAQARDVLLPRDTRLENGLFVRILEDHELPLVSVSLMVPAGAVNDLPGKEGLSQVTGQLLMQGTQERSAVDLAIAQEELGTSFEVEPNSAFTTITADFLSADLERGLDLLAELVTEPAFPTDVFEQERAIAVAQVQENLTEPSELASRAVYQALFGDHPYGRPDDGTLLGLGALRIEDVVAFYEARYRPRGAVLAITGDVSPAECLKIANRAFKAWNGAPKLQGRSPLPESWTGTRYVMVDLPGQTQTQIRVATRTIPRKDLSYPALRVADSLLGGGFTSWLMEEIRVERSLTYGASSRLVGFEDTSVQVITTFTQNETTAETLGVAVDVLDQWRSGAFDDETFRRARNYCLGMAPAEIETLESRSWSLLLMHYFGLPADDLSQRVGRMTRLSRDEVSTAARRLVPKDGRLVVVVGDLEQVRAELEEVAPGMWKAMIVK